MSVRALSIVLVCAAPGAALAQEPRSGEPRSGSKEPCSAVRFIQPVQDAVEAAVGAACADLDPSRADPTVSIDVRQASEFAGGLISILATSTDGREAFRSVSTPEAAGTSVIALLLLPSNPRAVTLALSAATPDAPPVRPAPPKPSVLSTTERAAEPAPSAATTATLGGTILAASHIGFGEGSALGVGVSGSVDVTLDETWAIGAHARVEPASFNLDREQVGGTFGGGPEAAYRFDLGTIGLLDLGVGADFLATVASYEHQKPPATEAPVTNEGRGDRSDDAMLDVRARVFGKFAFPTPFVSLALLAGIDVSPVALADGRRGRDEDVLAPVGLELGIGIGFRSDELTGGPP